MACPVWVASRELARKAAEWTERSIIICALAALWVGTEPSWYRADHHLRVH